MTSSKFKVRRSMFKVEEPGTGKVKPNRTGAICRMVTQDAAYELQDAWYVVGGDRGGDPGATQKAMTLFDWSAGALACIEPKAKEEYEIQYSEDSFFNAIAKRVQRNGSAGILPALCRRQKNVVSGSFRIQIRN